MERFKLWYSGKVRNKNGLGILVDRYLKKQVVEVGRVNDRIMLIKLVAGGMTLNIICAYAPQAGLDEKVEKHFWEDLDEVVRDILPTEKLFVGGDFNGHIGTTCRGYDNDHEGFGFWD